MHYTYAQDLDEQGRFTPGKRGFYHFDKREYEGSYPPRNLSLPAECQGQAIPALIRGINEASAVIEPWTPQM